MVKCFSPCGFAGYSEGVGTLRASAGKHSTTSSVIAVVPDAAVCLDCGNYNIRNEVYQTLQAKENGGWLLNYTGASGAPACVFYRWIVRRLTPRECERLQGFEDDWTKYASNGQEMKDSPRYTALGNTIAVPCAERIFRGIAEITERGQAYE